MIHHWNAQVVASFFKSIFPKSPKKYFVTNISVLKKEYGIPSLRKSCCIKFCLPLWANVGVFNYLWQQSVFSLELLGITLLQKTSLRHSLINQLSQQDVWRISDSQFAHHLLHKRGSMKQMKSKQKIAQMIPKQLLWKDISTNFI